MNKSLSAIEEKSRKSDQEVAAAALATTAAATSSASQTKDELLQRRLFVPGTLYHIRRQQLPPGTVDDSTSRPRKFTHTVVKGTDPNSRFGRIVLSNTMFADHSTPAYVDAVVDSLQSASKGYKHLPLAIEN